MTGEPLRNPRHEMFVKGLLEGLPASRAFVEAGYAANDGNAIRLKGNERVQARLAELQREAARSAKITVETICAELDEASAVAKERGQAQAMVSASALRAKLAGLMVERVEVGNPGDFDGCETTPQIVDRMLAQLIEEFRPVDAQDRQALIDHMEEQYRETQEFLDAIRARPIVAERVDPRRLAPAWQQLKQHPSVLPETLAEARNKLINRRISTRGNGSAS
jgi:hypothetical protein